MGESEKRFITSALKQTAKGLPVVIHQDKLFDFVYIDDLCRLVEMVLLNPEAVPVRDSSTIIASAMSLSFLFAHSE